MPHAVPGGRKLQNGDIVVIDFGCVVNGYRSDMTRTIALGGVTAKQREVYNLVLEAQLAGVSAVKAGRDGREIDGTARAVIDAGGHGERFGHGLGHGVGLEVHEAPRLSQRSEDTVAAGNVVTVEPGVYLPGEFGVRIEDLLVVGEDGSEILTEIGKDLIVTD